MKYTPLLLIICTTCTAFAMESNPQPQAMKNFAGKVMQELMAPLSKQYEAIQAASDTDDKEVFLNELDKLEPIALELHQRIRLLQMASLGKK